MESTSARDFLDLKAWIENDAAEPSLVAEFAARFRNLDLRKETKRGTSVYNGVFNLLVLQGARDWMSGTVPQHGDLDDHHIVPAAWGYEEHQKADLFTRSLNRTPLTADTNRHVINDRLPNEYLPTLIQENGEPTVRAILESHFISPAALAILLRNPFGPDDFEAFIAERQRTIQDAIENLLIKERLDLPPQLRELDAAIEDVELGVRKEVDATLVGEASLIPSLALKKVDVGLPRGKMLNFVRSFKKNLLGVVSFFFFLELKNPYGVKILGFILGPFSKKKNGFFPNLNNP